MPGRRPHRRRSARAASSGRPAAGEAPPSEIPRGPIGSRPSPSASRARSGRGRPRGRRGPGGGRPRRAISASDRVKKSSGFPRGTHSASAVISAMRPSIAPSRSKPGARRHAVGKSRRSTSACTAPRSSPRGPSSPARRRRMRRTPGPGSASTASNQRSKARSRSVRATSSGATSKSGSTPASTGRSRRRSAQKEWIVPMRASSSCGSAPVRSWRASAGRPGSCRARSISPRSRSFSSPAAVSVKVTATMPSRRPRPAMRTATMRPTSSVVLPVPAAASTTSVVSRSPRMRSRAS